MINDLYFLTIERWLFLALTIGLGAVSWCYAGRYLSGQRYRGVFRRNIMLAVLAIAVIVLTNSLILLPVAWMVCAAALFRMITASGRHPAQSAGLKYFLNAAAGCLFLSGFVGFIAVETGTLSIQHNIAWYTDPSLTTTGLTEMAVLCLTMAALLQCAQIPVLNSWLTELMEAATPVSALMHAGIVNLGGILLILFAPVLSAATWGPALLLVVGGAMAFYAGRHSLRAAAVKTRLTWSTQSQMGFMLAECALGYYQLALLHLLAHAIYKAHAFLNAGQTQRRAAAHQSITGSFLASLTATVITLGLALFLARLTGQVLPGEEMSLVPWVVLSIALFATARMMQGQTNSFRIASHLIFIACSYVLLKALAALVVIAEPRLEMPGETFLSLAVLGLYLFSAKRKKHPSGRTTLRSSAASKEVVPS